MTRQEAMKVLAVLKAAYPNSYKSMDAETASATVNIWATQFIQMPYEIVAIAIQKIISGSVFPPSIKEVKDKIRDMYYEAEEMLRAHKQATEGVTFYDGDEAFKIGEPLDENSLQLANLIVKHSARWKSVDRIEPTIAEIANLQNKALTGANSNTMKLN